MGVEQLYIDLFVQSETFIRENSSPIQNAFRSQALEDFKLKGFPTTRSENYKYTNLHEIFGDNTDITINKADFVVKGNFCDGVFVGCFSEFTERYPEIASSYYAKAASTKKDSIVALNTMMVQDCVVLYVPKNIALEEPIQLTNVLNETASMVNCRVLVIVEENAEAKLIISDDINSANLITQVTEIFVGENARFEYYDVEQNSSSTKRFTSTSLKQEASSNVLVNNATIFNGLTRNNYYVDLNGEYAEVTLSGFGILDDKKALDTYCHVAHNVPNCTSTQLFKNVLKDNSQGAFSARIFVALDAQKTTAYQTNRNLLLSKTAKMYSKPQLEIYADDVKCSHGMTIGQLDENALFYMMSRGISRGEARTLLSMAFTSDVLNSIRQESLKEYITELVEKRFRG